MAVPGVTLSGLVAKPHGAPRALLVALHGHGMTARYFAGRADAALSLLDLAAGLGFAAWAPDRPGYGTASHLDDGRLAMLPQAELLAEAIVRFSAVHAPAVPILLVGHSFGFKLALAIAAGPPPFPLLGVDGSGTGLRYTFEPGSTLPPAASGDLGPAWGPRDLYPDATFDRAVTPAVRPAPVPDRESADWPETFRGLAGRITVPVRFTFGEHDRLWRLDDCHFSELRSLLDTSHKVDIAVHANAGHNVSLCSSSRAYHLRVIAFAEECLAASGQDARFDSRRHEENR